VRATAARESFRVRKLAGWFALCLLTTCAITFGINSAHAAGDQAAPPADWNSLDAEALGYFRQYLRFDTTNPPDNTAQAVAYLKQILDREGIETETFESKPGAVTLLARLPGPPGKKPMLLLSHSDVVPAVASDWLHPPFAGDLDDGFVWGRGAIDNKAHGIMAVMTLIALKRGGVPLRRGVELMINPGEEAGGADGAQWMVKEHWDAITPAFAVNEGGFATEDPFGSRSVVFPVAVAEKRVMWLRLTAYGHSGHGSIPIANNPTQMLVNALARLLKRQPHIRIVPLMSEALADFSSREKFPYSFELAHLDWPFMLGFAMHGPLKPDFIRALLRDTIVPTMLDGSLNINVIPSAATAGLDCRLLPGTDPNAFLARIRRRLHDHNISIELIQKPGQAPPSPASGPAWDAIKAVAATDFPDALVVPWMMAGGTDSRFLREHGVPTYGFVPVVLQRSEIERIHGVDERLSVENLNLGIKATYDLAIELCGPQH
jgi:acetylornithine deacetylase/succinyl-diaminopimelate desuccinylase-like protein